jgi:EpsI family protein
LGNGKEAKLTVLVVLLLVTAGVAHFSSSEPPGASGTEHLAEFIRDIDGFEHTGVATLEEDVHRLLDLDDYTYTSYRGAYGSIDLYIGFYYTAEKISAAHSPLACYPAQGWTINQPILRRLAIGDHSVNFAEILAGQQDREELVLFWFQAHYATTPHARMNKLNALYNKLLRKEEQHAFVRVAVPVNNGDYEQARVAGAAFMKSFYPRFIAFIDSPKIGAL